jgi:hypothetical protein
VSTTPDHDRPDDTPDGARDAKPDAKPDATAAGTPAGTPTGAPTGTPFPPRRTTGPGAKPGAIRAAVQLAGFGVGVAMIVWAVRTVISPDNQAALDRLRDAAAGQIIALMALAASSLVLNAIIFWSVIRPVHRLRLSDMIAVNALATFLSYLPFKVSVICRWIVHNRRDGIHNLTIGAWFVVVAGLTVVTVAPMWLAFARPDQAGHWWWLVVAAAIALAHTLAWQAARLVRGPRGMARMRRLGLPERWAHREWFARLHDGASMSADGHSVWVSTLARVLDIASFGLRFAIAAHIIGVELSTEEALLIGLAYFVVGVVSPFGTVGTREAGALAMAVGAGVVSAELEQDALLTAILLVTVSEAVVSLIGAGLALAWLRADRLLTAKLNNEPEEPIEPVETNRTDADMRMGKDTGNSNATTDGKAIGTRKPTATANSGGSANHAG